MALDSYIFGPGTGTPTYEDLQRRRKILDALLSQRRAYPKTLGEGLTSIGDVLGEIGIDRGLRQQEAKARDYGVGRMNQAPGAVPTYKPYSPNAQAPISPAPSAKATSALPIGDLPPLPADTATTDVTEPAAASAEIAPSPVSPAAIQTDQGDVTGGAPQQTADNPATNQISPQLANAIMKIESGGNPNARTGSYKGLYQLSDSEFNRLGGQGSIYDPGENKRIAMLKLQGEADQVSRQLGRPLTDGEIYLVHQQGVGGALAHLRNPDQPAWQSMYSTAEGRQKGPDWARLAITGNIPTDMRGTYGPDVTSGDFARMWADKVARFGGGGRDAVVAAAAARPEALPQGAPEPPPGAVSPTAGAQDETLGLLSGRSDGGYSYPPTAALGRSGNVASDVPDASGMSPAMGASVIDSVQQGRNAAAAALQNQTPQPAPVPANAPPTLAPGSGQPIVMPDVATAPAPVPGAQMAQAPKPIADPRTQQFGAPALPPPMAKPREPDYLPLNNQRTKYFEGMVADPRLDPLARAAAQKQLDDERAQIKFINERLQKEYEPYQQKWLEQEAKRSDPATVYSVESARRGLEGEGAVELTPEQRTKFGIPPGQAAWMTRRGELKLGPAGTNVSIDQRQESAENQERGKLAAQRSSKMVEAADTASTALTNIARAEAMLKRIDTGAAEPHKLSVGAFAQSIGVPDTTLAALGLKPDQIGTKQAFEAIANQLVIGNLGTGGFPTNNFSNTDRMFLAKTVIALGDSPEANRIKLAAARLVHERNIEKADAWGDFRADPANKGKSFDDFELGWVRKVKTGPDATAELQKQANELLDRQKRPQDAQSQPPAQSPEDAAAMKWLRDYPNDPRAPAVRQKLGIP